MICTSGAIVLMTPWQVPTKSSCRPKSLRNVRNTGPPTLSGRRDYGLDQSVEIVRGRLAHDAHAGGFCSGGRLRSDRDGRDRDPELRIRTRSGSRGEHHEVALERLCRPNGPRSVERDEVGVELLDQQTACILGAGARPGSAAAWPLRRSSHEPSAAATSAVSFSPSWCAATGARQPPPTAKTHARSASTRRRVSA